MPVATVSNDVRALSRRWFEEVWNNGREEVIDEMIAPGAVAHGLAQTNRDLVGPAAFREFYRPMKTGIPDIRVEVHDVLADGDQTAVRVTARGTHTGPGLGVPPTGRPVVFTALVWARWREGQLVEAWNEFDTAGVMSQITGDAPPNAATSPGTAASPTPMRAMPAVKPR